MKIAIIVFSPSGHTLKVAQLFEGVFKSKDVKVQLLDITKNEKYLNSNSIKDALEKELGEHDVLLIGGPVYAGHVEHNILRIIDNLPISRSKYGQLVVPFVTYGGVHSSVALEEMGKHLKKKGIKSIIGVKIAAEHTLTKTFNKVINKGRPNKDEEEIINSAVEQIIDIAKNDYKDIRDVSEVFKYSKLPERVFFNTHSQAFFHDKHKNVSVDKETCICCKKCVEKCPVNMFKECDGTIEIIKDKSQCILCGECYHSCPVNAINYPYIEMAKKRLKEGYIELEKDQSAIYPK